MVAVKSFVFKKVPQGGLPVKGEHITTESSELDIESPPSGGLIIKSAFASLDPYMRGRMRDPAIRSYVPAFTADKPITGYILGHVYASDNSKFKKGDLVRGLWDYSDYVSVSADAAKHLELIDNKYKVKESHYIGALGMPGITAYSSLYAIGKPKKGETIFISSAAGAVGQVVAMLAKEEGLRVIGSVGSNEKKDFILNELKFDGATNYKEESTKDALKRLAPNGVDIYFENVGGEILEQTIDAMNDHGRIVTCGMISQYNNKPGEGYGIRNLQLVVSRRLTIQGFIQSDPFMGAKYADEHRERVGKWLADGSFVAKESITKGIDSAPDALIGLLQGKNFGKTVIEF